MVTAQRVVVDGEACIKLIVNVYMNQAWMIMQTCVPTHTCHAWIVLEMWEWISFRVVWHLICTGESLLCASDVHSYVAGYTIIWTFYDNHYEVKVEHFIFVILNPLTWAVTHPPVHTSVGAGVISVQLPYPCVVTFCIVDHVSMRYYSWQGHYKTDSICSQ